MSEDEIILTHILQCSPIDLVVNKPVLSNIQQEQFEEYGWEQNTLKILKTDLGPYIDADPDLAGIKFKIDIQKEKTLFIKDIISELGKRNWTIRNAISDASFKAGGNI